MKVAVVLGTRPEIIKMAPVIRELGRKNIDFFILHTGQHYYYNLDRVFFEQLKLPKPRHDLDIGSGLHGEQMAKILSGVERILAKASPDIVLVEGDTNSVLGGALAAAKLHIKVGHVEAGLRSYDRRMPEEINRTLTDHCSDYLFAPTENARAILLGEGIPNEKIFVTGNTIVDAVNENLELALSRGGGLAKMRLQPKEYFLTTLHRQENVDSPSRFGSILKGLDEVADAYKLPIVYPVHPRSQRRLDSFHLKIANAMLIQPVDFLTFLELEKNARLVLTDSGGVQEETCILGVPCVTLRDNTERPETVDVGANILAGTAPERILECCRIMLERKNSWRNPFGDGKAAQRIVSIITGGLDG